MLLLEKVLFVLFNCYYWKTTELAVIDRITFKRNESNQSDSRFTYKKNDSIISTEVRFVGADSNESFSSRKIIFPDALTEEKDYLPTCAHTYYCEDVEAYPYEELTPTLANNKEYKSFFGVDEEPIENRIGGPGDTYLCASRERVIFPQALKNKYNEWKYVVNQGDDFRQGVRIETCIEGQTGCKLVDPPFGYVTSCTQKFSYRRMLSVSSNGDPEGDVFVLPMACCCSYKRKLTI